MTYNVFGGTLNPAQSNPSYAKPANDFSDWILQLLTVSGQMITFEQINL